VRFWLAFTPPQYAAFQITPSPKFRHSSAADVVGRLLGNVKPLLMVTDPPYGVEYDPSWRNQADDVAYVWHGALHAAEVAESLTASGFNVRSQIIWAKDRLVLSRGDYHWQHEPCWLQ